MKTTFQVRGMSCHACADKIKEALKGLTNSIEITFNPPRATLEDHSVDLKQLNAIIAALGPYQLIPLDRLSSTDGKETELSKSWLRTYSPLLIIIGILIFASFADAKNLHQWMLHFMSGFFLIFGTFKLIDLKGFCKTYATYDLLAKTWTYYGYIYPFLELALGFAFLFQFKITQALWFSLILMGISSLGVIKALIEKRKIQCACLGTALNLPMSTITLIEDLGMIIMAIAMLTSL